MKKIDIVGIIGIVGTVLGIAGTVVSGIASNKKMDATIQKEVAKALAEKNN